MSLPFLGDWCRYWRQVSPLLHKNTKARVYVSPLKVLAFFGLFMPRMRLQIGLCSGPCWGSLQRSPDILAGRKGLADPFLKTPAGSPVIGPRPLFSALRTPETHVSEFMPICH